MTTILIVLLVLLLLGGVPAYNQWGYPAGVLVLVLVVVLVLVLVGAVPQ